VINHAKKYKDAYFSSLKTRTTEIDVITITISCDFLLHFVSLERYGDYYA